MQNYRNLDWQEILEKIRSYASSEAAKDLVMQTQTCDSPERAEARMQEILQAKELILQGIRPSMVSLDLYSQWISRLKRKASLTNMEIRDVRSFCLEVLALKESCSPLNSPWAKKLSVNLMNAEEPLSAIDQIMDPSGDIRADASEKLFSLTQEKQKLSREVQHLMEKLVHDHQMENLLQDKFVTTREGRWVLPIRSGMQHFMPGVIHGSSHTKQTVYMEPEKLIPTNNRLRQIEVEIDEEIERLITELCLYLSSRTEDFINSRELMKEADATLAQAQFANMIKANACHFSNDKIDLIQLRNPILCLGQKAVVANSVKLDEKRILLLSGPNAGGKTVLLKSIGLTAIMARCGMPIPADESSELPFFKKILVGIGDEQSVDAELSTFAAHMQKLQEALTFSGPDSLILIDEICGSTDPEEGSALARSFIEKFSQNSVFAVITSHLGPLKSNWQADSQILNGSLEYSNKTGKPTYNFISGVAGDSLALQTAKRVGIDVQIINRAIELLSPQSRARLNALEELENMKASIGKLHEELRSAVHKANENKIKYDRLLAELEQQKEKQLERSLKKAENKVEEAIQKAQAAQTLERHRQLQEIKFNLPEIVKAKPTPLITTVTSAEDFAKRYPAGTKVYVPSISQDGVVQSTPNSKGEVMILSGSLRLLVRWQDLKPPEKPQNPTAQILRQTGNINVSLHDEDKTLDLRGKIVDEALSDLEICLDQSVHSQRDRIKIIHGHGTEALKKAIRTYLSRSVYVKKWQAASQEGGGDGVTWVELNFDRA